MYAVGWSSDSYRYCLQFFPASRLAQRAPIGPAPFSSVSRLGARVPRPWHVVQPPMPVNTFSPAATSCSGVTLAPSVRVCGTSDCTCGIAFAISVYSASVPRTTARIRRLVPMHALLRRRRDERRLLGEPAEPEHERD